MLSIDRFKLNGSAVATIQLAENQYLSIPTPRKRKPEVLSAKEIQVVIRRLLAPPHAVARYNDRVQNAWRLANLTPSTYFFQSQLAVSTLRGNYY